MTDSTRDEHAAGEAAGVQPGETLPSQLSAFMDDELPSAELDLLVRRLERDGELKQTMGRYLLMGEALRQPTNPTAMRSTSRDFSARVAAALEQDAQAAKAATPIRAAVPAALWKNAAGLAVAASVAMIALVLVRQPTTTPSPSVAIASSSVSSGSDSYIVPISANGPAAPIPAARLTNYVVAHSEFSSPLGRQNLMTGLLAEDHPVADTTAAASDNIPDRPDTQAEAVEP